MKSLPVFKGCNLKDHIRTEDVQNELQVTLKFKKIQAETSKKSGQDRGQWYPLKGVEVHSFWEKSSK